MNKMESLAAAYALAQLLHATIECVGGKPKNLNQEEWMNLVQLKVLSKRTIDGFHRKMEKSTTSKEEWVELEEALLDANGLLWEVLQEVAQTKTTQDRIHMLALLRSYNAGEIKIEI